MIVFEYLHGMMEVFGPLMDEWAHGHHRHIENEDVDDVRMSSLVLRLPPGSHQGACEQNMFARL